MLLITIHRNSEAGWIFTQGLSAIQKLSKFLFSKSFVIISEDIKYRMISLTLVTFSILPSDMNLASYQSKKAM